MIERETGDPCGTVRANAYTALTWLGSGAVYRLYAALDLDSPAIANAAVAVLDELGRGDLVGAWCSTHTGDDVFAAACTPMHLRPPAD